MRGNMWSMSDMLSTKCTLLVLILLRLVCCVPETNDINQSGPNDPDAYLNTLQIIARYGYPAEAHMVTTADGYILTVHRIPYSRNESAGSPGSRQPLLLQHGLLGSSNCWVTSRNKSLAFVLSDAGYDVWLGNARGSTYSIGHVNLLPDSDAFWNFSWHEMGMYDLPAVLAHIEAHTGRPRDTLYVGHSMGTTMFFVYGAMHGAAARVKAMVALAPVAFMDGVTSPVRFFAPWASDLQWIAQHFGVRQFLPSNKVLQLLVRIGCEQSARELQLCEHLLFLLCGFDKQEFNVTLLPSVLSHGSAGSSTKTVLHYLQEMAAGGRFQQFDYGPAGNKEHYGTKTPPPYNLSDIRAPLYLVQAQNDRLAGMQDVAKLQRILNRTASEYVVPIATFNHIDFLWGRHAASEVYGPLLRWLRGQ